MCEKGGERRRGEKEGGQGGGGREVGEGERGGEREEKDVCVRKCVC